MLDWLPVDYLTGIGQHQVDGPALKAGLFTLGYAWSHLTLEGRISNEVRNQLTRPMEIQWIGSPNFTPGRLFQKPRFLVLHWINGDLAVADSAFSRRTRMASAHYGVQDGTVHQYVNLRDAAWHCGVFTANLQSVGIEHAGSPTYPISDATYSSSAKLIAYVWKECPTIPVQRESLRPHKAFKATQCPGTLDLDRLYSMAKAEYDGTASAQGIDQPVTPGTPATQVSVELPGSYSSPGFIPFLQDLEPSQAKRDEVARVQRFLVLKGFLAATDVDPYWGCYGKATQGAVDRFQKANGIPTASKYGYWYPKTREAANKQLQA